MDVLVKFFVFLNEFKFDILFILDSILLSDDVVVELLMILGMFVDVVKGFIKMIFSENRVM